MNAFVFLYITCPDLAIAKQIATKAINEKLAACANLHPIMSIYKWDNEIQNDEEYMLILKTQTSKVETLTQFVEQLHPYDVPCITQIPVQPNESYANWLQSELS